MAWSESELKPCPFCRSKDVRLLGTGIARNDSWARCEDCRAEGPMKYGPRAAIEAWNAAPRPEAAPVADVAEDEQKLPRRWG